MGRSGGGIRQDRSAVGVEEEGYGEGCPLPIRLGERPKLPQRVGRKRFLVHLKPKSHLRHHFKAKPAVFDSKADTPKDIGVPVLKLLCQWPIGVLTPPPMMGRTWPLLSRCSYFYRQISPTFFVDTIETPTPPITRPLGVFWLTGRWQKCRQCVNIRLPCRIYLLFVGDISMNCRATFFNSRPITVIKRYKAQPPHLHSTRLLGVFWLTGRRQNFLFADKCQQVWTIVHSGAQGLFHPWRHRPLSGPFSPHPVKPGK